MSNTEKAQSSFSDQKENQVIVKSNGSHSLCRKQTGTWPRFPHKEPICIMFGAPSNHNLRRKFLELFGMATLEGG